ncbi:peroxisomal membrane anchor protein conserved region-domain-containing protein [Aspergillus avenaceus]|uniref:Peroxisomal membrane protein PEX14 n=1 Tax=Aspergillus avenaceus TaxID=36643 RepID=A0A5N6TN16_ASPAV|nr:peroxisomal membrane anchor protein conserved region-domain-containing protein [Aspergillus avenaceus]
MADSDSKPPSIPQWQRPSTASDDSTSTPSPSSDDTSRSALLQQATKFLQDDALRDAPLDRKVSFLESKGLRRDEIDGLLDRSDNGSTTQDHTSSESNNKESPSNDSASPSPSTPTVQSSSSSSGVTTTSTSTTPQNKNTQRTSSARDMPPIITYPEFMVKESKPPPLMSLSSILYTIYGAAGLGASIYGASEFLVKPMLANLTSARHDLAQTADENLRKLNEKLEQNVSTIPPQLTSRRVQSAGSTTDDDTESLTSDPAELFHRDVAVQTSDDIGRNSLSSSAPNTADEAAFDPAAAVNTHVKRLEVLRSHLQEFSDSEKQSSSSDNNVRTSLNELHHYLDGLLYSKSGYGPATGYGAYSSPAFDSSNNAAGLGKGEEDAISSFKSEIRGVKGALLSARNFPGGRGARMSGGFRSR